MGADSDSSPKSTFDKIVDNAIYLVDAPVVWFRKTIVEPNRKEYHWYHQKYRRVPTIDECYNDDPICKFEANQQFKRDKLVDNEVLNILRQRFEDCTTYEAPNNKVICQPLWDAYNDAVTNWFIKYGDLGAYGDAESALMKQKHRLIWERRYGPVGTGKIPKEERQEE